ncbi:MAG: sulfatase-like hydrolase/transferase [Vicinamibacteria bacterium]|nr:sulfatase-like hydrolase/transferase [Vicinamibacteria bacterium]
MAGAAWGLALGIGGCRASEPTTPGPTAQPHPSILVVTLDTTRADAIGPEARGVRTPAFDAVAARGLRFRQAYSSVPETLPAHTTMFSGLYPAGHGVHENARSVPARHPLVAQRLSAAGYRTAAFVSSFVLARRFGIARGFEHYDDQMPAGSAERSAAQTTERALAFLATPPATPARPLLMWVHYFDPHAPYAPPEPWRSQYPGSPYLGEVAAMDEQLGRLVKTFEEQAPPPRAILIVGDHGEGLGEHGEAGHGHLLYQGTMHVPLVIAGPGVAPGTSDAPVSQRRVFHTLLDWAGLEAKDSLRGTSSEVVMGEAMKPFLAYGWQPQVMAVAGRGKAILAGLIEHYDVVADPAEASDLSAQGPPERRLRDALREYPVPSPDGPPAQEALGEEERRQLASLGYVASGATPVVRPDAPRPADKTALFAVMEETSNLFVRGEYRKVIPLLQRTLREDPGNLDAALRLATAHSSLGQEAAAEAAFAKARDIAPGSPDVRTYLGLHYARTRDWQRAIPLLERSVTEAPDRLPALEGLAGLRERQQRWDEAIALRQRVYALREPSAIELLQLASMAMTLARTELAIESLEKARTKQGAAFEHHLELGVVYLAARRLEDARRELDQVPAGHPGHPMALFKRAQVSVLLNEPDQRERLEAAKRAADPHIRELITRERLFQRIP